MAVQNVATNYLNKKGTFHPLPLVDMELPYNPTPTSKKAQILSATTTKKSSYNIWESKPPIPKLESNADIIVQLFLVGTNGSPVSHIQLLQPSILGASSNVRSIQSPIISTDSPPTPKVT